VANAKQTGLCLSHTKFSLLNQQLADAIGLGLQTKKQAHWNGKGPHLIGLHELFDKVAEEFGRVHQ
jgi:DNA-binding ferritin-like protein